MLPTSFYKSEHYAAAVAGKHGKEPLSWIKGAFMISSHYGVLIGNRGLGECELQHITPSPMIKEPPLAE